MNQKVLVGFMAGAIAASGITYFASHRKPNVAPAAPVPVAEIAAPAPPIEVAPPPVARTVAPKKIARTEPPAVIAIEAPAPPVPPKVVPQPEPTPAPAPPAAAKVVEPAPAPISPPRGPSAPEPPRAVTLGEGTLIAVRLGEGLSTKRNQPGDTFSATLDRPLQVDGIVIAERGARAAGRIIQAEQAGRVKGLALLGIELTRISTSDGQEVAIHTAQFDKTGPQSKGEDAAKIGVGAVLGTIIGAAAGGGKGAAIGAATGGAAGTGTVMATRGKPAELPVETLITFKIDRPVTITERK